MLQTINGVNIDFWYNNTLDEITAISCAFSSFDCIYRGNIYIKSKCVGDFSASDSVAIEKTFAFTGFCF